MKQAPLCLLAFANDHDAYLQALDEEERKIRAALSHLHDQRILEVLSLGSTSLDDMYKHFNRFHNRIVLFHFGGHSDSGFLKLSDQNHRAANLAALMGMNDELSLVVLNGCSNKAQVTALLKSGVKAVVATSHPLIDEQALIFTEQFYNALVGGKNIQEAFDTAINYLEQTTQLTADKIQKATRDTLDGFFAEAIDTIPYGLFSATDADLQWTLPSTPFPNEDQEQFQKFVEEVPIDHLPDINKNLVIPAVEGLAAYHPDILAIWNLYQATPSPAFFNILQNSVIDKFPSFLGIQICDLFTPEALSSGRKRLKELNDVYTTTSHLLLNLSLANLWDAVLDHTEEQQKHFVIQEADRQELKAYLHLDSDSASKFDYLDLTALIVHLLLDNGHQPFLTELALAIKSLNEDKTLYVAYRFMEQELRQRLLAENIASKEVPKLCLEAEKQLGLLLKAASFISAYEIASVKDILVRKRRKQLAYVLEKATLRGRDLKTIDKANLQLGYPTDDRSLLVTRSLADDIKQLNLSPFLIDRNAFSRNKNAEPDLYFFSYRQADGIYQYHRATAVEDQFTVSADYDKTEYSGLEMLIEQFVELEQDLNV